MLCFTCTTNKTERIFRFLTWIRVPGVKGCRHGWNCVGRRSAVWLHQDSLYRGRGGNACPQGGLQRGDAIKLYSGETAHEARGVITLDQNWINLTRFWNTKTSAEVREKLLWLSSVFITENTKYTTVVRNTQHRETVQSIPCIVYFFICKFFYINPFE